MLTEVAIKTARTPMVADKATVTKRPAPVDEDGGRQ
jgi:hypothetical protein